MTVLDLYHSNNRGGRRIEVRETCSCGSGLALDPSSLHCEECDGLVEDLHVAVGLLRAKELIEQSRASE